MANTDWKSVWMHPTSVSPACRYDYKNLGDKKKLMSSCGMWETYYESKRVLPVQAETQRPEGECCIHCVQNRRVSNTVEPQKRRSWSGRRSPVEPYFPPTRF